MIQVKQFPLGPLQTNCFLLFKDKKAVVIDPGGEPTVVINFLEENQLALQYILNTHFHFDHILGNKALQKATQAKILANPEDEELLKDQVGGGGMMGLPEVEPFDYDPIYPGESEFLEEPCQILSTPGHSKGSISFYFPKSDKIFSGDLIFQGSIGRTDFPGGSMETLIQSVKEKVFTLPENTVIYSGHGPVTTVKDEKLHNPFFQSGFII